MKCNIKVSSIYRIVGESFDVHGWSILSVQNSFTGWSVPVIYVLFLMHGEYNV